MKRIGIVDGLIPMVTIEYYRIAESAVEKALAG